MPKPRRKSCVNAVRIFSVIWYPTDPSQSIAIKAFERMCTHFIFQFERGLKKGRLHGQAYVKTKLKIRDGTLGSKFNQLGLRGCKCSAAFNDGEEAQRLKDYCMKEETRVDGPWGDAMYESKRRLEKELTLKLLPWQKKLSDELKTEPHPRKIIWYVDKVGSKGKSTLAKWLYYHNKIVTLTFGDAGNLLNLVYKFQGKKAYCLDLSRTKGGKSSMSDIYQTIESIKNGYFINTKYETGVAIFAIPHVVVFSNKYPQMECLSMDRWDIRMLN